MFNDRRSLFKFFSLTLLLGLSTGLLLNYYGGNTKEGFVSPVVFGKEVSSKAKNSSPFSALFDKLVQQQPSQAPLSPASTLSYKGTGAVLGEKTTSSSVQDPERSSQSSNNSSSGSSSSSNTSPTTSNISSTTSSSSSTSTSTSTTDSSTTPLTSTQQAVEDVTNVVTSYLKSGNYTALYNLMSADFKSTFSPEDFVTSFSGSPTITVINIISTPRIYGANNEWAEQSVQLTLGDGSTQNYLNIYHLEGSGTNLAWALFATQDQ